MPLLVADEALAWGRKGHEAITELAERHLTRRTRERIAHYLDNHPIVYYAKWMDDNRNTPEYGFTTYWHTAPADADLRYTDSLLTPRGNAVHALEEAVARLHDYRSLDDSTVNVNLKYIIHLVGDMHCPAHVKYTTHAMKYDVLFEGKDHKVRKRYVHHVWDNDIIQSCCDLTAAEWAERLDDASGRERRRIERGTPRDWFHDCAVSCEVQFEWAKPDSLLGADFLDRSFPLVESQIRKAGYRLAALLNELFD